MRISTVSSVRNDSEEKQLFDMNHVVFEAITEIDQCFQLDCRVLIVAMFTASNPAKEISTPDDCTVTSEDKYGPYTIKPPVLYPFRIQRMISNFGVTYSAVFGPMVGPSRGTCTVLLNDYVMTRSWRLVPLTEIPPSFETSKATSHPHKFAGSDRLIGDMSHSLESEVQVSTLNPNAPLILIVAVTCQLLAIIVNIR